MTLTVSKECEGIEEIRATFVPLSSARLQRESQPAHDRVTCLGCHRQVNPHNPKQSVRTDEGYLCTGCAEDDGN